MVKQTIPARQSIWTICRLVWADRLVINTVQRIQDACCRLANSANQFSWTMSKEDPFKFSSLAPQHSKQWQCGHCHGWSIFVHQARFQARYRHSARGIEDSKYTARYAAGGICNMHGYAKICKRSTHAEIEAECSSSTCKGRKMGWIVDDNGFEDLC